MTAEEPLPLEDALLRLKEAEETLAAIRAGAVDALVVDGLTGPQVCMLESPDQPFRIFVEQMEEGALTINSDGVILYCNRFFTNLVKRPTEQVRGRPMREFVANEALEMFDALREHATTGAAHGEGLLQTAQGTTVPVQLAFNRLPAATVDLFGVVVTDLTERERALELETARRAAEEANAARDQFLAVVSHELRTPLNAILGWTQLLRYRDEPASLQRGLEVIERSAKAQAQLIDDLLDVSRVLAGKLRLERQPVRLQAVIETALETVQTTAAEKAVSLQVDLPEQPLFVDGDAGRLQQVIWNLLTNAIKFTPERGQVTVRLESEGDTARIEVKDNGIGIPPAFLPRLFEFYQQIDSSSTTRRSGGLGLGLAIVKQITELHGGQVWANSLGEGQGATFNLALPLYNSDTVASEGNAASCGSSGPALDGVRLLLVEDEQDAREVLASILEHLGVRIVTAASAEEALALVDDVDILVSDIGLPDTDGYELIRRVRASGRSGRSLPAVALTAFAGSEDRRKALLAGYQVHIPKPVNQDELCAAIASLAGHI
jgi:PAS domain S-box-containing protein